MSVDLPRDQATYAKLEIVGPGRKLRLPGNELARADRDIGELEGLDNLLGLEGPNVNMAWSDQSCVRSTCSSSYRYRESVQKESAIVKLGSMGQQLTVRIHGSVG